MSACRGRRDDAAGGWAGRGRPPCTCPPHAPTHPRELSWTPRPAFPLSPVTGGKSETVVNASLEDLEKGYAINGHKSAQDLKTYVFCGDIKGM